MRAQTSSYFSDKETLEVRGTIEEILEEQEKLIASAEKEKREFTDEEERKYNQLQEKLKNTEKRLEELNGEDKKTGKKINQVNYIQRGDANMSTYNLARLVRDMANEGPKATKERELSQELEERTGIPAGQGALVPLSQFVPETREIQYSGSGSNLVDEEHYASQFIDVLRNQSHVMSFGPTVFDGLKGDLHVPRKTGSASTGWISGDSKSSTLSASDITFDTESLSPKFLGALTEVSMRVDIQSDPAIRDIIRQDFTGSIGVELDRVAIEGGDSNEPTGINRQSGINEQTFSGSGPTWTEILSSVEKVMDQGMVINNGGFLSDVGFYSYLKSTDKLTDSGNFLAENGQMDDYPVRFSNNMPADHMLFGNWSDLIVAFWGVVRILVNPYEHFDSGSVQVRAILPVDLGIRHAESFTNIRKTTT